MQWASVKHWISSCWAFAVPQVHLVVPAKTRIRNAWTKRAGHGELPDSSMCSAMYAMSTAVEAPFPSPGILAATDRWGDNIVWKCKFGWTHAVWGWVRPWSNPVVVIPILKLWAAPGRGLKPFPCVRNCTKKHLQVFADVYHLDTLENILSTCAQVRCQGSVEGPVSPVVVFRIQYNAEWMTFKATRQLCSAMFLLIGAIFWYILHVEVCSISFVLPVSVCISQ